MRARRWCSLSDDEREFLEALLWPGQGIRRPEHETPTTERIIDVLLRLPPEMTLRRAAWNTARKLCIDVRTVWRAIDRVRECGDR
jgi:hypothetical protein